MKIPSLCWLLMAYLVNVESKKLGRHGKYVGLHGYSSAYDLFHSQNRILEKQLLHRGGGYSGYSGHGSTYVRWGRSVCPGRSKLLYEGFVAGSYHASHKGGGANTLCLPRQPQWGKVKKGSQNSGAFVYGAEFMTGGYSNNPFPSSLNYYDAVCAVCYTPGRTTQVMIPAWNTCPHTWTKEYNGYIMSSRYNQYKSEYVCVDWNPEKRGSKSSHGGLYFYTPEVKCGSIPCSNYPTGYELTCVVCTK